MIVIKNSQLDNETVQSFNSLLELDINGAAAFKLMRIIKEVSSLVEDKVAMEKKIFDKWVEKDEYGNPVPGVDNHGNPVENSVKIKDMVKFNEEMNEIMSVENTLNFEKLNFEDLRLDTVKIKDLIKLDFLFN